MSRVWASSDTGTNDARIYHKRDFLLDFSLFFVFRRRHFRAGHGRSAIGIQIRNAESQFERNIAAIRVAGIRRCNQHGRRIQTVQTE